MHYALFGFSTGKNDPYIRVPAAFPALNRVNDVLKTISV